jgi:hypothetical protein
MSDGTGEAPKKETVFGGPTPAMDNQSFANPGTTGTVYGGSSTTQGTVYGGPTPGGTVYGGAGTPTAQRAAVRGGMSPQAIRSANWFFWIAALSAVNSIVLMSGGGFHFFIGLGVTQLMGGLAGLLAAGIMALFGFFARQGQKWAFLVGGALYALDGVLLLIGDGNNILSAVFHGLVLFFIFRGFREL